MQQVLPVLLDHGLCNLTNLSSVNKHFRQVINGPQSYFQEHKLRYFARAKRPDGRKRWIRLVIRGQVLVQGKTVPKPNSTWTVEIYKGSLRKGLITMQYTTLIASFTLDLRACRVTNSKRLNPLFVHPDPWIVVPLVFTRTQKLLSLTGDPRGALSWLHQTTTGLPGWPRQTKPPRFLRVAFGYLGFYSFFHSSPYNWPYTNGNTPQAFSGDGSNFLYQKLK